MTAGVAESWAKLRLVQGDSSAQVWELVAARGQTTLTVGSGPSSSWVVSGEGVRPLHFSLHWDGETLRIADTYGAGDVRVDGAPVSAQWRTLAGRGRIEFGKAAMVAETSTMTPDDSSHPLEPSPPSTPALGTGPAEAGPAEAVSAEAVSAEAVSAEAMSAEAVSAEPVLLEPTAAAQPAAVQASTVQRLQKATLIGVSPLAGTGVGSGPVMGGAAAEPEPPQVVSSFQPARPESERTRKPTLLGMAISIPPAPPTPTPQDAQATQPLLLTEPASSPPVSKGIPSGTLIGVAGPHEVRVQRFASVSDQASPPGAVRVELDDMRVGGSQSSARVEPQLGAVTQAEVRTVSSAPSVIVRDRTERIGSTWQETSGAEPVPAAVMLGANQPGAARGFDAEQPVLRPSIDGYDTYGDIPTQMREAAGLDSKRPAQTFPWRYVGIGLLTAAAYFAWLYLLDHL